MNIDNKIVWVTGASNGIGKGLAIEFAKHHCKLILSSRNVEKLQETQRECKNFTQDAEVLPLDLEDIDSLKQKTENAISIFGRIDILVNCGGISQRSLILDTDISVDRKLMEVDYLGTVALSKVLLPHFIANHSGVYVVISSVMGKYGSPYRSGYCGAKHALHGFFDVMRMEHEKDGVKVTIICPGFVNTDVTRNALVGDGSHYGSQDDKTENGLPVEVFSRKALRAIEKEKWEVYIGKAEAKAVYIKRFFPKLLHKIVMKSRVR
ncbi:MAG: SDR family oxidoreductase [Chitinophagaceae bacterium]|nr:SDR family oxidoreductase [Chitinophagaceae bacterium]